jgi:hypothetical protein
MDLELQGGEVCCYGTELIIGPCDDGENGSLDVYECRRVVADRILWNGRICREGLEVQASGSTCVVDATSESACVVPRPAFACGTAAAPGLCVSSGGSSTRSCVKSRPLDRKRPESDQCNRGRDCAPDGRASRVTEPRRPVISVQGWAGQDISVCESSAIAWAIAVVAPTPSATTTHGIATLRCRPPCKSMKKSDYCSPLSFNRYGGALRLDRSATSSSTGATAVAVPARPDDQRDRKRDSGDPEYTSLRRRPRDVRR